MEENKFSKAKQLRYRINKLTMFKDQVQGIGRGKYFQAILNYAIFYENSAIETDVKSICLTEEDKEYFDFKEVVDLVNKRINELQIEFDNL